MRKHIPGFFDMQKLWESPALVLLSVLFLCGAAAGCFTGLLAAAGGAEAVTRLADGLKARASQPPGGWEAARAAGGALGWQAAALFVGWTRPAGLLLPLLCGVQGFTLSFSAAALLRAFGREGLWCSLAVNGIAAVAAAPCLLLTAAACFLAAQDTPRGGYFYALGRYRGAVLACTLTAMWAAVLQLPLGWMIARWIL